jgi:flagellar basal-body rod protein FlgB
MSGLFAGGFQSLESALIARERAQGVYAGNIANADTPNYRADTRTFKDFLAEQSMQRDNSVETIATHPAHFSDAGGNQWESSFVNSSRSVRKMDGNSVDPQKEMAKISENQLMHELTLRLIKGRLGGMLNAVKEGR